MQYAHHFINSLYQGLATLITILFAIWQKLYDARKAKGFTIEDAAELFEVSPVTYSRWEHRRQKPHPSHLLHLIQVFGPEIADDMSIPDEYLPPSYWN